MHAALNAALPPDSPVHTGPRRRWWRALATAVLVLGGCFATFVLLLQIPAVGTFTANQILAGVPSLPRASMRVKDARGSWITNLRLYGFEMRRGDTLLVAADTAYVRLRPWSLLIGRIDLTAVEMAGAEVGAGLFAPDPGARAEQPTPQDPLSWPDLLRGRFYGGPELHVGRIVLRDLRYRGASATDSVARPLPRAEASLYAHDLRMGRRLAFTVDSLVATYRPRDAEIRALRLSLAGSLDDGRLRLSDLQLRSDDSRITGDGILAIGAEDSLLEVRLEVHAAALALSDLEPFFGDSLRAAFPLDGTVAIDLTLSGSSPQSLAGRFEARLERASVGTLELGATRLAGTLADGVTNVRLDAAIEGAPLVVEGRIRPFEARPVYALDARMPHLPRQIPGVRGWSGFVRRAPFALNLHVEGSGYADARAAFDAAARGPAGAVTLRGSIDRRDGLAWELDSLVIDRLDVARLSGDSLESFISAVARARGGTRDGAPWMRIAVDAGPSAYGARTLDSGRLRASLEDDRWGASLDFATSGGAFHADTMIWRMDGPSPFRAQGLRVRSLDLSMLTDGGTESDLNADLTLEGRGLAELGDPRGPLDALRSGRVRANARVVLGASTLRGRALRGGVLSANLAGGRVTLEGDARSDAGWLRVAGEARPFDAAPHVTLREARFGEIDAGAWTDGGTATDLSGVVRGEARVDPAGRVRAEGRLRLDPSRAGPVDIAGAELTAQSAGGRTSVDGAIRTHGGAIDFSLVDVVSGPESGLRAEAGIPLGLLADLLDRDSLESEGSIRVHVDVDRTQGVTGRGTVTGRGRVADARLDSLGVRFGFDRRRFTLDTLLLASNVVRARGQGHLALGDAAAGPIDSSRLHAEIELIDALPLDRILSPDSLSFGDGALTLDVAGAGRDRRVNVAGSVRWLQWNDLRIWNAEGSGRGLLGAEGGLDSGEVRIEAELVHAGDVSIGRSQVAATLDGDRTQFDATFEPDETHRFHVAGAVSRDSVETVARLDALEIDADTTRWTLVRPAHLRFAAQRLAVDELEVRSHSGRIAARGVLDRRGMQTFSAEVRNLDLGVINAWFERGGLDGTLDGAFALSGPATDAQGDGTVFLQLRSNGTAAGALRSVVDWDAGGLTFDGAFTAAQGESLSISGDLPLALSIAPPDSGARPALRVREGTVDVEIRAQRFPLPSLAPLLDPLGLRPVDGRLDVDMRLTGTSQSLRGDGRLAVAGGAVDLTAVGARFDEIELGGAMDGDRIIIEAFRTRAGKGRLEASGAVRLAALDRIEPDLEVRARRARLVDQRKMRLVASGDLTVRGTVDAPVLRGQATLSDSHYQLSSEDVTTAEAGEVELTAADLRMLQEHFVDVDATAEDPASAFYEAVDIDLDLTLGRDNWVRQSSAPRLAVEVTGDVRVVKRPGEELLLYGRLEPVASRGYIQQFGRSFDFSGGEVLLNGAMEDHRVDVQTSYRSRSGAPSSAESDIIVHLNVRGTPDALELELSSEPALSETQIVSYIATGRDPTALGAGDESGLGTSALARDIGLSQVSGPLEEVAQERIGLDVLQVRYDALQGATLVAGRYLDPTVYVGFRQPLQYEDSSDDNTGHRLRTRFEIEYEAYRWLVLNLQGELASVRSFIRVRREY